MRWNFVHLILRDSNHDRVLIANPLGPFQEKLYGRPVIVADREMVEQMAERILDEAQTSDVAFLVVGDPFGSASGSGPFSPQLF